LVNAALHLTDRQIAVMKKKPGGAFRLPRAGLAATHERASRIESSE
jgi:hypothetical protein